MRQSEALLDDLLERQKLGAKLRATRAILNLSQAEFAARVGLTQRSIHRLEQAQVDAKRSTIRTLERFWSAASIVFEDLPDGGFTVSASASALFDESPEHHDSPNLGYLPDFPARVPN